MIAGRPSVASARQPRTRLVFVSLVVTLLLAAAPATAHAEAGSMSVGPSKITISLLQGDSYTETLYVENDSSSPLRVAFEPWDFAYDESGKIHAVAAKDAERFRGASSWVKPLAPIVVKPKTEATVPLVVTVPKGAGVGTHSAYVRLVGQPLVKTPAGQSVAKVRYQLNALLLVVVQSPSPAEKLSAGAKLVSFTGPAKRVAFDDPVPFNVKIDNTGNVHLDLAGKVVIKDAKGRLVTTIPVKSRTLLPESLSSFVERWGSVPSFGRFSAQLIGECSITDIKQDFRSQPVEFWYVSRPLLYGSIAAFVALVAAYFLLRKRFSIRIVRAGGDEK